MEGRPDMKRIVSLGCLISTLFCGGISATAGNEYAGYYADSTATESFDTASNSDDTQVAPQAGLLDECCPAFDECDCERYDCCDDYRGRRRFGFLPSDHCFDDFVSPLSNPFFFEDPRSLTEVRGIFIDNGLPNNINGGDVHVWAAQLRGRITDRTSIIAPRLGYLNVNQANSQGAPGGFMSAPIGFKYNLVRDVDNQFLLSGGLTYFIKGSEFPLPGSGDFHFYLSGGKQIFDRGHWLSGSGFRIPVDSNWGTQFWYWSNQWDYEVFENIYPLVGVNWFHFMKSASAPVGIPVTGLDLLNIPANGVAGENVVTGVAGIKWKPSSHFEVGAGYEFPLTDRTDILRNRLYADLIFRY
jgi:hypothetical protein